MAHTRTLKDATKALQTHFTGPKIPLSLPSESRRMLQAFVDEHVGGIDDDDSSKANQELKHFWDRYVASSTQKLGPFVGVLKELRPAIVNDEDLLEWYHLAGKPVTCTATSKKAALEDAHEFVTSIMTYDEDAEGAEQRQKTSTRICKDLLGVYVARTRGLGEHEEFVAPDNAQIAKQVEGVLVAFGKKMPKHLFNTLDDLVLREDTRLQGLTLLSTFLQHQAPHLYLVDHTPLVDHLLKCLMNDTSTTVLSVALKSLIMLLPHIPNTLGPRLPRLFLIYSRLLCWEKFSPLSTEAQKNLVTDDRVAADDEDYGDVGIDPTWEKCRPREGVVEPATPEIMTYFTYLYGLYPLNFMSYIRKPRRFLKNVDFPGADDFDLDQAVIRSRSDQFRQAHLLHPNFYNLTVEEELIDPKWPKMDPADVVAECHSLAMNTKQALPSPGPPPTGRLPDLPPLPPIPSSHNGSVSPAISHTSFRSGHSWRDTQSTATGGFEAESPILGPVDDKQDHTRPSTAPGKSAISPMLETFPMPVGPYFSPPASKDQQEPQNNMEYLQQKITALQNDLSFERWHKAQYSQHIGQLMRKNVKDATVEAETLNLINANRALKQQLEQVRSAREATIKDSNLTRKQASNLESNMTERFNKMKKEQETWAADADELKRLRAEMKHYRDLLSTAEARELKKSHEVEMMKRDMEQLEKLQSRLKEAQSRIREYEYREFDFEQSKREQELLQSEKETLLLRLQRHEQDRERTRKMYADRIAELEAHRGQSAGHERPSTALSMDNHATQQALVDAQGKLAQLKKAHSRLLERFTDLEMEYQSCKNQLDSVQGYGGSSRNSIFGGYSERTPDSMSGGLGSRSGLIESVYDVASEYGLPSEGGFTSVSQSDPTPRRYQDRNNLAVSPMLPISPPRSEATLNGSAGLTWKPASTTPSTRSYGSSVTPSGYNPTAPLASDEKSVSGQSAGSGGDRSGKPKIAANSEIRVYGRGGAQNIKMKSKEKEQAKARSEKTKSGGGLKTLKGFAGL